MSEQSFSLNFKGYWLESHVDSIPSEAGIYCVFTCLYGKTTKTIDLSKLIYIGEAEDINQKIKNHEKLPEWKMSFDFGEELCFSYAHLESAHRERVEAALIFKHKPSLNDDYKDSFHFDRTTILITGASALLTPVFTVEKV